MEKLAVRAGHFHDLQGRFSGNSMEGALPQENIIGKAMLRRESLYLGGHILQAGLEYSATLPAVHATN